MPTINATVFPTPGYVLVEANWSDYPAVQYARVVRRNTVTGEEVLLRPYVAYNDEGDLLLNCSMGLWWDTEPPLNVPLEYCTYAPDTSTSVLLNSTFETGVLPWSALSGTVAQSAVFAHSGTFSALVTPTGTQFTVTLRDATGYALPATQVTMQAWVLSPQGFNAVSLRCFVRYTDDNFNATFQSSPQGVEPGEWTLLRMVFDTDRVGTALSVGIDITGTPSASTLFYIDDVTLSYVQPIAASACDTVTVPSDAIWLRNPLNPCLDMQIGTCSPAMDFDCAEDSRVSYAGMANEERPANTVLSEPVNQLYPIPTSRQRRAPRSELRLIAHDCDARDEILANQQPGTPLLFQAPEQYCIPDRYLSVGAVTESRISIDQRETFRLMVLPYAVVGRPQGPSNGICGTRIIDLCDIYTSWQAMTLAGLDWQDLLLGAASNDGPVDPLPPDGRVWDDVNSEFANWTAVLAGGSRDWDELRDGL